MHFCMLSRKNYFILLKVTFRVERRQSHLWMSNRVQYILATLSPYLVLFFLPLFSIHHVVHCNYFSIFFISFLVHNKFFLLTYLADRTFIGRVAVEDWFWFKRTTATTLMSRRYLNPSDYFASLHSKTLLSSPLGVYLFDILSLP